MRSIRDVDVENKRVLVRVDFNVPQDDEGKITDNNRIKAVLQTINFLSEKKAKTILMTHLGKPDGKRDPKLSTVPLAQELAKLLGRQVYATEAVKDPSINDLINQIQPGDTVMLGNLRWDPGEEANDEEFAQALAKFGDMYVNNAFAVSHREAASLVAITKYLPSYAGFLLESEVTTLGLLLNQPKNPFVVIIGGAKVKDKASVINHMASFVDYFLIGGAVANTFLAAKGVNVGESVHDADMIPACQEMLAKHGAKIILPDDGVREGGKILDIGPATVQRFTSELLKAQSILWNGNLGYTEDPKFCAGTKAVAEAIRQNQGATKVAAGGDTVGYLNSNGFAEAFSFISTGGGAALEFLAGENLPGIEALKHAEQMERNKAE